MTNQMIKDDLNKIAQQLEIANQLKCLELMIIVSKNPKAVGKTGITFLQNLAFRIGIDLDIEDKK